jgi:Domain of unknown function (DUF4189)
MKRSLVTGLVLLVGMALIPGTLRASSAVAFSSNGVWAYAVDRGISEKEAISKALDSCRKKGGIDPKIVASSSSNGCSSIATSGKGKDTIIGCALACQSTWQAQVAAMRDCKQKGGLQARSVATFQEKTLDNLSSSGL